MSLSGGDENQRNPVPTGEEALEPGSSRSRVAARKEPYSDLSMRVRLSLMVLLATAGSGIATP